MKFDSQKVFNIVHANIKNLYLRQDDHPDFNNFIYINKTFNNKKESADFRFRNLSFWYNIQPSLRKLFR